VKHQGSRRARSGFSIVELIVATTLFVVVMASSLALMERDAHLSRSTLAISAIEDQANQMLHRIERELADALVDTPTAIVTNQLAAGSTTMLRVDSTLGFPEAGRLLLSRDSASAEIVSYTSLGAGQTSFDGLSRGLACTLDTTHPIGMELLWVGLAETISDQTAPPAAAFDGLALEQGAGTFFRGEGAGVSFRVPVDPTGATPPNYLDGEDIRWGAVVGGVPTLDGWIAIEFVPATTFAEADTGDDVNEDGDTNDVFDIGQLRRRVWDTSVPGGPVDDLGLGPTAVLQERCNWGGDLDGDGFDDPIFLWNQSTRTLHVRLFVVGRTVRDLPIVRRIESVMFLRNENGL
jgi:hypothetical protein